MDMAKEKRKDWLTQQLPPMSTIILMQRQIGLGVSNAIARGLLNLIGEIIRIKPTKEDYSNEENFTIALARQAALVDDLIASWRMLSVPGPALPSGTDPNMTGTAFHFPRLTDETALLEYAKKQRLDLALSTLWPEHPPNKLKQTVTAAVATYLVLSDPSKTTEDQRRTCHEFHDRVHEILAAVNPTADVIKRMVVLSNCHDATISLAMNYVVDRWGQEPGGYESRAAQGLSERHSTQSVSDEEVKSLTRRLNQSLRVRNLADCVRAWQGLWGSKETISEQRAASLRTHPDLFDLFIKAFAACRMPKQALTVWNTMSQQLGMKPTIKTWTAFMEGCRMANNVDGIRRLWAKLVESGQPLDTVAWTARITCLIRAGDIQGGLEALGEMQTVWEESLKKAKPGGTPAVRPTIEPVNAALAGAVRMGANAVVREILAWAGRNGIAPDIFTYNTLLRRAVRAGDDKEVNGIFSAMKAQGIAADPATFTIILEATIPRLGAATPEVRAEVVENVLSQMEQAGLENNMQTYGKIIYLLLHQEDGVQHDNGGLIDAVLASLERKGLELSTHIYTMLVEHYFSKQPIDFAAIDALMAKLVARGDGSKAPLADMDRVFWERVVRGYAQAGDSAAALAYFGRIAQSQSVTTKTLEELLRALLRDDRMDDAAWLVGHVKAHRQQAQGDLNQADARFWKHAFWHLARQYNLG